MAPPLSQISQSSISRCELLRIKQQSDNIKT